MIGIGLIGVSVLALAAPLAVGTWSLQFLSLFPLAVGLADLYATITNPALATRPVSYAAGLLAIAAALLLFLSPSLVVTGVVSLLLAFLVIDGTLKVGQAVFGAFSKTPRTVTDFIPPRLGRVAARRQVYAGCVNLPASAAGWGPLGALERVPPPRTLF
jgi:hypothetical protein